MKEFLTEVSQCTLVFVFFTLTFFALFVLSNSLFLSNAYNVTILHAMLATTILLFLRFCYYYITTEKVLLDQVTKESQAYKIAYEKSCVYIQAMVAYNGGKFEFPSYMITQVERGTDVLMIDHDNKGKETLIILTKDEAELNESKKKQW